MRGLAALFCTTALLAVIAGPARAAPLGDNTVRLAPSRLKLPQAIGPLRFNRQSRFSDRRLGRSYAYNASGLSLSIYVYDSGLTGIPDGPDSAPLCVEYEEAKDEIERGGNYENVTLRSEFTRRLGASTYAPRAREALYELDRQGVHAVSVLWLTAIEGHFIKLRLSLRVEVADELDEARSHILAAMGQSMAEALADKARRPGNVPVAPASTPEAASVEVDNQPDPATAAAWLAYALELSRRAADHPELVPACGGLLAPDHATELAGRRAALAAWRQAPARAGGYFAELQRFDDAGLLEEYVWQLRREAGGGEPEPRGLDVATYEEFRRRELPDHRAQSGARVRIHTVRPLPEAPAAN